jgi:two-component system, OmpR family, KDP operon response regulator KdpE
MAELSILLIEDEPGIVRALEPTLRTTAALVKVAWSGSHALDLLAREKFDLILCDLGLPDVDGLQLIPRIRASSDVPIIVLSASGSEQSRIAALDGGADDFVGKPFAAGELLARIRAVMRRRTATNKGGSVKLDGLEVDLTRRRVLLEGQEIKLSAREHALITLLARNPGVPMAHKEIIQAVWGKNADVETQFVRVLVGQLRQKIEADPSNPRLVCTEPGVGYRLNART